MTEATMLLVKADPSNVAILRFEAPAFDLLAVPERARDSRVLRIASVLVVSILPVVVADKALCGPTTAKMSWVVSVSVAVIMHLEQVS
jgi:hypothetical protein